MPKTVEIDTPCDLLYDYSRIPDGSRVETWLEGEAGKFVCLARVRTKNSLEIVEHDELFRAPDTSTSAEVTLRSPEKYVITFFVNFRKDATATLVFRLVHPDGNDHTGTPVRCTLKGEEGDEAPAQAVSLWTLQKSAS